MKIKILLIILINIISFNCISQDSYMRVVQIMEGPRSLRISAVDSDYPTDTVELISFKDTIISKDNRPLNHFWSSYGNYVILKVGESYPFYTFEIPYLYIPDVGYIIMKNGVVISLVKDKNKLPKGIANSFGWTLQWWNPILPHGKTKPYH